MFMSRHFPLQPRHVDGVLYVDFYGISTVNSRLRELHRVSASFSGRSTAPPAKPTRPELRLDVLYLGVTSLATVEHG